MYSDSFSLNEGDSITITLSAFTVCNRHYGMERGHTDQILFTTDGSRHALEPDTTCDS